MNVQRRIEARLGSGIPALRHLEVVNESSRHSVPPGSESHFKVTLVSDAFKDVSLLARHRMIHRVLADELAKGVHALAIHAYTPDEWRTKTGQTPQSPPCLGGRHTDSG